MQGRIVSYGVVEVCFLGVVGGQDGRDEGGSVYDYTTKLIVQQPASRRRQDVLIPGDTLFQQNFFPVKLVI